MVLNAADQGWANAKQIWTGEPQDIFLQKGVSKAATAMGASPETASQASAVAGLGQAVAVPGAALSKAGKLAEFEKAEEEGSKVAAQAGKEAAGAEKTAPSGAGGVRVAKSGYTYEKDALHRTTRASGKLRLKKADRNNAVRRAAGGSDRLGSDQGGHLIGSRFDGPSDAFNTVAHKQKSQ